MKKQQEEKEKDLLRFLDKTLKRLKKKQSATIKNRKQFDAFMDRIWDQEDDNHEVVDHWRSEDDLYHAIQLDIIGIFFNP